MPVLKAADPQMTGAFAIALYDDTSLDKRFSLYDKMVCGLGFDAVCYSFLPRAFLQEALIHAPIFKASESFPQAFLTHYEQNNFYNQDFTIREIKEGRLQPKDWKSKEKSGELSEQECHVIKVAREDYAIQNAITIPAMNHSSGIAGASLISQKNDQDYQAMLQQHQKTLTICTQLFNDAIIQQASAEMVNTFVFSALPEITPKERIVLRDLVCGLPLQKIGAKDGLSESAVSNHLARLRDKFDVKKTNDLKHLLVTLNIMDYL